MSYARIRPRRGTLYEFSTINPVLDEGELVVEFPEAGLGNGFCRFKIGDGIRRYNDLSYSFDGAAANKIVGGGADNSGSNLVSVRYDDLQKWLLTDPVLEKGEIIYDSTNNSIKVGDGIHTWSELKYICAQGDLNDVIDCGDEG